MSFTTSPLQEGLPFGIRIDALTLAALQDKAVRDEIDALFFRHGMIVFEAVEQSDEMQLAISSCFGPLKEHPVKGVSRVDSDRLPGVIEIRSRRGKGIVEVDGRQVSHWLPWPFDHCYNDELNRAGVLRSVERVEEGGITGFLDGVALYAAFPEDLRARIEGREIAYRLETQFDELRFGRPARYRMIEPKPMPAGFAEQVAAMPRAIHPAVWTRATGEKVLHVSAYMAQGIVDDETSGGGALLEDVCQEINRLGTRFSYQHKWRPDDMVIWDNLRILHCVSGNDPAEERLMYRTTIAGDYGLGRWETAPQSTVGADAMV
ncbi:TauD/TfdA family dioxygenase [Novosphingobium resinovorum]|uniref:TauD/TfdA dioxygenase family protein n=1 Tax=Novosphingobium TaxID=165696 RepID=UPI001B3C5495|nr:MULTISPECIES: TauD/TfdA family dioxygenase [Novosphingobium]MBF7010120.1 TauD/TfdA family dioxygenase [Novosphingobium sp. HR1a]WJM28139.1 TauD/TfdA family dioxygenase [Novosphingobium resinovorum]